MEKVNETRNGTAEPAQSTPMHPWPMEVHQCKLFMRLLTNHLAANGWEADYSIPAHTRTKRDATAQYVR